jgi:hypothetical protein
MKYKDKLKNRQSQQKSNTDFYSAEFEHDRMCSQCGKTYPRYDSRKTCCGVSLVAVPVIANTE